VRAQWRTRQNLRRGFERVLRCGAAILALAAVAANASAQLSGTATLTSNYRFRGISLSENKPAAQLGVAFDAANGWYAGAFASTVEFAITPDREVQVVPFLGYVWRAADGLSWEAGTDYSFFSGAARNYNYPEVYVGVASQDLSARVYYSNHYFGQNSGAVYAEANGARAIGDQVLPVPLRLLAHVGILHSTGGVSNYGWPDHLFDASLGVASELDRIDIQLSWVGTSSTKAAYSTTGVRNRNGPLLTISVLF
jgi:uncharacterized protein (TIGR02001 family)